MLVYEATQFASSVYVQYVLYTIVQLMVQLASAKYLGFTVFACPHIGSTVVIIIMNLFIFFSLGHILVSWLGFIVNVNKFTFRIRNRNYN